MSRLCGTSIDGGCLCRAIRYTITFPPDDLEPLKVSEILIVVIILSDDDRRYFAFN